MRTFVVVGIFAVALAGRLPAQSFTTGSCDVDQGNTNNRSWFSGGQRVCELRRTTVPLIDDKLSVDGKNSGIEVIGEDRQDIALEARVIAQGSDRDDAQALVRAVKIVTTGTIHAEGPELWGFSRRSWSVNFRLRVPRHLAAQLHTENGGIDLANLDGVIHANTTNGGLSLDDLSGDVQASTVNGGLKIKLEGTQWRGAGLFARSTNGGVSVKAPDHYSAHLVAETVNGGVSVDFPITIRGTINNHIDTNLGEGGPTLHFQTVNGGVSIARLAQ